jgi:signal transduction histidine kinase
LIFGLIFFCAPAGRAQPTNSVESPRAKRVLMIFSEARDLPGNVMMERSARAEMLAHSTNAIEFFTESLDAGRFPNSRHYAVFHDYIRSKYAGQNLDAVIMFLGRDFTLAKELPTAVASNLPAIFVVVNDLDSPGPTNEQKFTGIFQRFDIEGMIKFIFHLQPETRRVVVIGGKSTADQTTLRRIEELARTVDGIKFDFWTNRPIADLCDDAKSLPEGTVIWLSTVQRDATGQPFYTSQVAQMLASASVPVYVLGAGLVGSGAVGGNVIDLDNLGTEAGRLALRALAGTPVSQIPVEVRSNGVPMVDWRALQRWHIKASQLPADCVIRYRPQSLWENHREFILFVSAILVAQAMTITALLVQRSLRRQAEAEILKQRTELAHVARVSMMGQLASALTHELNQPLGAILRNAEAAEIFLQSSQPNLDEVRAILTDIRRDDKRAGNVIDRMRSLFKRQTLASAALDLRELVEDTVAMARPDAEARHTKLKLEMPPHLPAAQCDRVHVQQVLLNLILNGMDAMDGIPKNRRSLSVRVAETKNGNVQVAVTDCGIGIAPDDADHVFEPFFTTKSNGMGMGLAISRTIIEAHGGELWLNSSAMDGTTFTFILPPAGLQKIKSGDLPATP